LFPVSPYMQRNHWLLLAVALLIVGNIAYHFWNNWGLITVHAKNQPLGEVIRSIEKQGHVAIKTNMDLAKPVQMDVDKVVLAEALETLSVVTDGRWRLAYLVAQDQGAINAVLANMGARFRPEGWRTLYVPLPGVGAEPVVLPDPRKDAWAVKPAKEPTLQSYLEQASRNVSASFFVPEQWNPPITSPPKAGEIGKALPKLVSAVRGKYEEIFLLQGARVTDNEERGPRGDDESRGNFREAMEERVQNEINKLPPAERVAAEQDRDERRKFFDGMKDLTPEQRDAKIQDRMENANLSRDARRTPKQRMQQGQKYLQRMAASRQGGGKP
jgi:hypothetical protein